jgi:Holliday junction resolvasome RuvABC endonuclease subunit
MLKLGRAKVYGSGTREIFRLLNTNLRKLMAITGNGNATKEQVAKMLQQL